MKTQTVAAASLNLIPLDFGHNVSVISRAIAQARKQGAQVLCLPELCLSGYGCEDAFFYRHVAEQSLDALESLIAQTQNIAVCFGLPLWIEEVCYNAVAFVVNGSLKGFVCKQHLAGYGIHYEPRWFAPWKQEAVTFIKFNNHDYPCGDLVFDLGDTRIGFEICEDAWVKDRPGYALASRSVDIILNPSASHFSIGKVNQRREIIADGSRRFDAVYVYANHLGNEAGRVIYDGDTVISQDGIILSSGPRLSFKDYIVTCHAVNFEEKAKVHGDIHAVSCSALPQSLPTNTKVSPSAWEQSNALEFEEFSRATALGLFDYMRKSRSRGFVLSLSGGTDSGCVAVLVYLLSFYCMKELSDQELQDKLSYWPEFRSSKFSDTSSLTKFLLHCVYQGTENSSDVTRHASQAVAQGIGAHFNDISIQDLLAVYIRTFEPVLGRKLNWSTDDLALQNIQARVRSPGIWLVANCRASLLLTTSNRSEAAVGYATMDGDMSGGLAPIAGVSKHFVQRFLAHLEQYGLEGVAPLPWLSSITRQAPTAELRPLDKKQTDESDLMPYIVLDSVERDALFYRCSPSETLRLTKEKFSSRYSESEIEKWVATFFRLWRTNQWKRERTAPSFHLDSYNIDPRSWFRFPIVSGGL